MSVSLFVSALKLMNSSSIAIKKTLNFFSQNKSTKKGLRLDKKACFGNISRENCKMWHFASEQLDWKQFVLKTFQFWRTSIVALYLFKIAIQS